MKPCSFSTIVDAFPLSIIGHNLSKHFIKDSTERHGERDNSRSQEKQPVLTDRFSFLLIFIEHGFLPRLFLLGGLLLHVNQRRVEHAWLVGEVGLTPLVKNFWVEAHHGRIVRRVVAGWRCTA